MATPRNITRSVLPGVKLRAGRPNLTYHPLLDMIAAATPGTWIKANANLYSDAWAPAAFRSGWPTVNDSPASPKTIINAWCSFAWRDGADPGLVLFGGGHANSSSSEIYEWRATDRAWRLAYHTTQYEAVGAAGERSIAGSTVAPISAHTYANQVWLEKLNRFITFGGAAHSGGANWVVSDQAGTVLRPAGPFTLDLSLAGLGYVSGPTGSNVKRAGTESAGVSLTGANAWSLRDYWSTEHPVIKSVIGHMVGHRNGTVVASVENNHDVVYVLSDNGNAGSQYLYRIELVDTDYRSDLISIAGAGWNNGMTDQQSALDPKRKLFVVPTDRSLEVWNLNTPGDNNRNIKVATAGIGGAGAAEFQATARRCGLIHDERRGYFVGWEFGKTLWRLSPPATNANLTTGWTLTKLFGEDLPAGPVTAAAATGDVAASGVHGKWKRSAMLDVYVGLQHNTEGQVWMFKPHDWLDPRGI